MTEVFETQKKVRKAKLVTPPNLLKKKAGSGGFDPDMVSRAQTTLEENTVDFKPIATELLAQLGLAVAKAKDNPTTGEASIESMIYPAMQLRAQGSMFHYPLVTQIADILVNYLETITEVDADVCEIVVAHKMSMMAVIGGQMKGEQDKLSKGLCDELIDACDRYYKARKT